MSEATPVENGSSKPNKPPVNLALIVAVVALGLTGWQYLDTRQQLNKAQQALAERLADAGGSTKALQNQAEQAQASTRELQAKLALVEARVNESAGQYATLSGMYQELTKDRSDWLLSEVEHTLASPASSCSWPATSAARYRRWKGCRCGCRTSTIPA
ncbi:hypothetical protein ACFSQE_02320 [Vogesella fluminis]|uniref:hypothetical protein n=1 Tax=Vogesella fluminis TaxID=1069161 RepID=UPI00363933E8